MVCGVWFEAGTEIDNRGTGYEHRVCPEGGIKVVNRNNVDKPVSSVGYQRKDPSVQWIEDEAGNVTRIVIDWGTHEKG